MAEKKYDIFISYRRDDGGQYARILQLELEKYNYKVFLDYEELTDGVFGDDIIKAIQSAPIFIMVLTPLYLARSMEPDSWVTKEIKMAIEGGKHFIPVDPDKKFNGIPENTPEEIAEIVRNHQHSSIDFGQALKATVDLMVQNRIIPYVPLPKPKRKRIIIALTCLCVLALAGAAFYFFSQRQVKTETKALMAEIEGISEEVENTLGQPINWSSNLKLSQLQALKSIMGNMVEVEGGSFMQGASPNAEGDYDSLVCLETEIPQIPQKVKTFFICQYEVSVAEWCGIMDLPYDKGNALMPIVNVTFEECETFAQKLADLCGFNFRLPTEAEWEYAARGGQEPDSTVFAGSDVPEAVAWFGKKSPHVCDATHIELDCNSLNLYDMSGNVCEWCDTPFRPYDPDITIPNPNAKVIRGGYYGSEPYELTVYHRDPMPSEGKSASVGLRLVIGQ
ncbi:MAG: SUMF1/EgtB/PvdO family nonheme iron enzyme [Bacteroidales bacterium]|nr:SUMF1/EgtB/PvdO family nonheme iron enzyme [Bacteroidales bacterium]